MDHCTLYCNLLLVLKWHACTSCQGSGEHVYMRPLNQFEVVKCSHCNGFGIYCERHDDLIKKLLQVYNNYDKIY